MSNRMITTYRIPLITDPVTAGYAGMVFSASRARTEQAVRVAEAFGALFAPAYAALNTLRTAIDHALSARELFALTDVQLAARGLDRQGIPAHVWNS